METYISTLLCIIFYLFFCKILQQKLKANVVFQRLRLCSQYQLFVTAKSNCCEQVVSNDELQSVEHRVVIKSTQEARVSIGLFFNPAKRDKSDLFGPLPELVTAEKPPLYRSFHTACVHE
jgi:hypothetical protein